jgi:hypothetical protein
MKIVRGLVSQIGGRLDIASDSSGRGACFTIAFSTGASRTNGA